MSAKERALRDLISGKDLDEVKKEHSSGSLYRAFPDYEKHVEKIIKEARRRAEKEQERVNVAEKKAKHAEMVLAQKVSQISAIEEREKKLITRQSNTKKEVATTKEKLNALHDEVKQVNFMKAALAKKGMTKESLAPFIKSDVQSPEELMERIQTKEQFLELKDENTHLLQNNEMMAKKKVQTGRQLVEVTEAYKSKQNEFDELQSKHSLWFAAIQLIASTLKLGFSVSILNQTIRELRKLSITKEPKRSARRVLSRMNKVVREIELDDSIARKQAMLVTLEQQYSELVSTIEALKNNVFESIKEVQNIGIRSLDSVSEVVKTQISNVAGQSTKAVQALEQSALRNLDSVRVKGISDIGELERNVSAVFFNNHYAVATALDLYKDQIAEWGEVQQKVGRYNELMKVSTVFLGIHRDEQALLNMNPAIVARLVERVHRYIQLKWLNAKTRASNDVAMKEFAISDTWEVDLTSVSSWLVEAIRQQGGKT